MKSVLAEAEFKKFEDEIKEDFLNKKNRVIKHGANNHVENFLDYHNKLISLMPWFEPHSIHESNMVAHNI